METFSIVDKINMNKLNTKVEDFICRKGYQPYIFANKETLDALTNPLEQEIKCVSLTADITSSFKTCLIGRYRGNKVFRDDTLKFGEIELR